ncbi:hypothetical protein VPH35_137886 [Triticum aestivum]|uniref:Uncharacterized protein n=1 Tax=Aegilops tauschii subsp. strangulata TaxID=200361 RepID=A0A453S1W2_AEGTS
MELLEEEDIASTVFSNNSADGTKQSRCRSAIFSKLRSPGCFILYYAYEFSIVYFRDHFQISMSMGTWATCVYANVHTYRGRFCFVFLISLFFVVGIMNEYITF